MGRRTPPNLLIAISFLLLVIGILGLAEAGSDLPRCNLADLGCLLASHEGLAGGLLGAAGTVFAGWLAYSAAQEAAARALAEARAAKYAALSKQFETYAAEIDRLKLARTYLKIADGRRSSISVR
jgi:hypothetical protein